MVEQATGIFSGERHGMNTQAPQDTVNRYVAQRFSHRYQRYIIGATQMRYGYDNSME